MSDAVNDWNTRMPDTVNIAKVARTYGGMGFDVHTVTIELSGHGGKFNVDFLATDADMQDYCFEHELDSNGDLERF